MKRLIILGYFSLMILVTILSVKVTAYATMDSPDITFRKTKHELTDKEIEESRYVRRENWKTTRYYEITETRTKGLLGWNTKMDTTKTYVMDVSCNCNN